MAAREEPGARFDEVGTLIPVITRRDNYHAVLKVIAMGEVRWDWGADARHDRGQ